MIENATDNKLNTPFGNTDIGYNSDNQKTESLKNAVIYSEHLKTIEIPSCGSNHDSTKNLKDAFRAIEQLSLHELEHVQMLNEIARVYVDILRADGVCIFESYTNGNVNPLVCYPRQSNGQCSAETLHNIINPSVLCSIPAMTSALEKDESIKVWQIPLDEKNLIYSISLPLTYNTSTICAIALLCRDLQIFSSDNIDTFKIIAHLAASLLDNIRQRNVLEKKQIEEITLQEEIQGLQNQIDSPQRNVNSDTDEIHKELEALSYSISHDLRAPLRAIHSNCEWLKTHHIANLDSDGRRVLKQISESSENMEKLLDGLLEFSKTVHSVPDYQLIDMSALVQKVSNELLETEGNTSTLSILIKPLISAYGDETLIHQVWHNLLSNAFKFSGHKQKREVEIDSYHLNGDITYCVSDNGAGFDMQYADRLFCAFHRLHGVEEFEGTGVGLAIVNRIIKKHGGRVWAEGKIDNGAKFYFTLPERKLEDKN